MKNFKYTISLFRLWIIFVFVMISTLLIVLGSDVYEKTNSAMNANADIRTASGFIMNKYREYGASLTAEEDMLTFRIDTEDGSYYSKIYFDGTCLKEAFLPEGYAFSPGNGEIIAELDGFEVKKQEQMVEVVLTKNQNTIIKKLREG